MSYRFKKREPLARGFARIAREELEGALDDLRAEPGEPPGGAGIHEARRRMKKLRALLRLMRPALGEKGFAPWNSAARDASRSLSAARDAAVRLATFDRLLGDCAKREAGKLSPLRQRIARAVPKPLRPDRAAAPVNAALRRLRALLTGFDAAAVPDGDALVCESLRRTYQRARRSLAAVKTVPSDETLHTLRKRVKDLQFQILLIQPAAPERSRRLFERLDRLADDLGLDHDLAMLAKALPPVPVPEEEALHAFLKRLRHRRRKFQRSALRLAGDVFESKPAAWLKPLARAWTGWHEPS